MTIAEQLTDALARVRSGDREGALGSLLVAWRTCRDPRIAATIEALSAITPSARPTGKTMADKQAAWLKLAKQNKPGNVGGLLATIADIRKNETLRERIWKISERDADPRIASALFELVANPVIPGQTGTYAVRAALAGIVAMADPRQLAALDRHVRVEDNSCTAQLAGKEATPEFRPKLVEALAELATQLDPVAASVLARIDAELAAVAPPATRVDAEAALFVAVYADPPADAPRAVLADALIERGDPRGELIALQLARRGAPTARERELVATFAREWLGPLEPVIQKTGVAFARGFLVKCALRAERNDAIRALADRPEWSTVEDIDISTALFGSLVLPRLAKLRALHVRELENVPDHVPHLERLIVDHVAHAHSPPWQLRLTALLDRALPALQHLELHRVAALDDIRALTAAPLVKQLASFELDLYTNNIAPWIATLVDVPVPSVVLSRRYYDRWGVRFADGVARIAPVREPSFSFDRLEPFAGISDILDGLPTTIRAVVDPAGEELPAVILDQLARRGGVAQSARAQPRA